MPQTDGRDLNDPQATASASPFEVVGAPGTAIYGGYIVESEKDSRLTGQAKYETYANILANTTIVAAGIRYFLNILSKAEWVVQPSDPDSTEAEELAEQIQKIMHDMRTPWHRVVRRAAMYKFYGFSVQEWTMLRREDGTIAYKDIAPRAQQTIDRWGTNEEGEVEIIVQRSPQTQTDLFIPRAKCIYLVDDTLNDSPEGLGIFRHLAKVASKLERYEILEQWGFERDLRGVPIGRGPLMELEKFVKAGQLTSAQANAIKAPIESFLQNALKGKDTALFLDSAVYKSTGENNTPSGNKQWDIELLQAVTSSQPEMAAAIERLNREMARLLGVEQLLLGSDSRGSHALSKDKTQSFGMVVDSTLEEIRESFEKDFLDPLFDLNGWDPELKPSYRIEQAQFRDIAEIASVIKDLATAGAPLVTNDPAINEFRSWLGLSDQPEQEEVDLSLLNPIPDGEFGAGVPMGEPQPKEENE